MSSPKPKMGSAQHLLHLLIFLGGVLLVAKPSWMPAPEIGKAVGEAFLIALVVIYLVEVHSHKRLENTAEEIIRKIGKNIIPLVYGHELPLQLVEALEKSTLQQPVYRDKMRLHVELTPASLPRATPLPPVSMTLPETDTSGLGQNRLRSERRGVVADWQLADDPKTTEVSSRAETVELAASVGLTPTSPIPMATSAPKMERLCRLASTYSYTLINCSDEAVKNPLKVLLERDKWLADIIAEGRSDPFLEYVKVGDTLYVDAAHRGEVLARLSLPPETSVRTLETKTGPCPDGNGLLFEEESFQIPAKGRVDISFHGVLHKRYSDNEVWSTFYPTLEVDLSISSVDFDVEARFPEEGTMLKTDLGGMSRRWSYNAPLLAGQAVLFWWRPKVA